MSLLLLAGDVFRVQVADYRSTYLPVTAMAVNNVLRVVLWLALWWMWCSADALTETMRRITATQASQRLTWPHILLHSGITVAYLASYISALRYHRHLPDLIYCSTQASQRRTWPHILLDSGITEAYLTSYIAPLRYHRALPDLILLHSGITEAYLTSYCSTQVSTKNMHWAMVEYIFLMHPRVLIGYFYFNN